MYYTPQAFDEPWESSTVEFGAVNITGFRIIDPTRPTVKEFLKKWSALDPVAYPGAGKNSISVCLYVTCTLWGEMSLNL
jgi:hypothetical protein